MSPKTQIIFIHGGDSFASDDEFFAALRTWTYDPYAPERKRWRDYLASNLLATHELLAPAMPNKQNANYTAWSIWFDKVVPHLRDGAILIGHSLGGGFLLRYLTEHTLEVKVGQLHLVAPVIDEIDCPGVGAFGITVSQWSGFASHINEVHLWHATDDTIVPIHHSERLHAVCPEAVFHRFTDRGHFLQPEFPELLSVIQTETVYA